MEPTKEEREKIVDQIRKIKRKADGTNHEAEAEIFLKKVADLLSKHGLTEADLREEKIVNLFGHSIVDLKYSDAWRFQILEACAAFCGCYSTHLLKTTNGKVYGRPMNVDASFETYFWVHDQVRVVAKRMFPNDTKSYRQAQKGLANGVSSRIYQILKNYRPDGATDTSVPMIVEADAVRNFVQETVKGLRPARRHETKVTAAFIQGHMNADQINLRAMVDRKKATAITK